VGNHGTKNRPWTKFLTWRFDKAKPRASSKLVGAFGQLPEKAFDWEEA
jgi:hypothetical protein